MEQNTVHNLDFLKNELPDKSVHLAILDPPYFEIKGEFDFIWDSFDDYLQWIDLVAKECKRLLKDNGTLFVYGHAKRIAYIQVIFDKYFNLENNLCIEFNRQTKKGVESFRCFAPVSERCLMYSNESESNIFDFALYESQKYIKELIYEYGGNVTNANEFYKKYSGLNGNYRSIFFGQSEYSFYTEKQYSGLCEYLKTLNCKEELKEYSFFYNMYLKNKELFELERRPFNNFMKLFDVMKFDQEAHITKEYDHDTCKPQTLTRALILTCSRENDLILVPFAGSGTECACAKKEKRNFIGFEINPKYVEMSNKRCKNVQKELF